MYAGLTLTLTRILTKPSQSSSALQLDTLRLQPDASRHASRYASSMYLQVGLKLGEQLNLPLRNATVLLRSLRRL